MGWADEDAGASLASSAGRLQRGGGARTPAGTWGTEDLKTAAAELKSKLGRRPERFLAAAGSVGRRGRGSAPTRRPSPWRRSIQGVCLVPPRWICFCRCRARWPPATPHGACLHVHRRVAPVRGGLRRCRGANGGPECRLRGPVPCALAALAAAGAPRRQRRLRGGRQAVVRDARRGQARRLPRVRAALGQRRHAPQHARHAAAARRRQREEAMLGFIALVADAVRVVEHGLLDADAVLNTFAAIKAPELANIERELTKRRPVRANLEPTTGFCQCSNCLLAYCQLSRRRCLNA
ncbi:hypothetical protein ACP70R_035351 [Stipagrostis hirtigluma subsp. patula]